MLLSCCGHTGCAACVDQAVAAQRCHAAGCAAAALSSHRVPVAALGSDPASRAGGGSSGGGGPHGSKLTQLVRGLQAALRSGTDRALVFVQFPDLAEKVCRAAAFVLLPLPLQPCLSLGHVW